ncbi:MAG: tetratricopeptide repeat protein [Bacteroidia bacterium]|nr:tetratricopeptide repeat protein [Bacteroidia bacterium]
MITRTTYYLLILIFFFVTSGAKRNHSITTTANNTIEKADELFANENYRTALPLYIQLLSQSPNYSKFNLKAGICCMNSNQNYDKALYYLSKAEKSSDKEPQVYYYIGRAYHFSNKIDQAIENYEVFKVYSNDNDPLYQLAERNIEMCNNAKSILNNKISVTITNLGKQINSSYSDFSPLLTSDQSQIFFTSKKEGCIGGTEDYNSEFFSDIYTSKKVDWQWSYPNNLGNSINTDLNDIAAGLSLDGHELLIYREDYNATTGNIYWSHLVGDLWQNPEKLGKHSPTTDINSEYSEKYACISPDENTIYFTSDRPGGFGGTDLYKIQKLPTGEWGLALNLGDKLNTVFDESAPFMHFDGTSFFFCSNGHNSIGGFDIFTTTLNKNKEWDEPINIGYPINSTNDDIDFVLTPDKGTGYFASIRPGGFGGLDIYQAEFQESTGITIMRGKINVEDSLALKQTSITVTERESETIEGLYHPNHSSGKFIMVFTPGRSYTIKVEAPGYECYTENITISKNVHIFELDKVISLRCKQ